MTSLEVSGRSSSARISIPKHIKQNQERETKSFIDSGTFDLHVRSKVQTDFRLNMLSWRQAKQSLSFSNAGAELKFSEEKELKSVQS